MVNLVPRPGGKTSGAGTAGGSLRTFTGPGGAGGIRCGTVPAHCWVTDWFEHASLGIALLYVMVHQQDIRRPLGLPRGIPADRLRAALNFARVAPPIGTPWRLRGLRLIATDLDPKALQPGMTRDELFAALNGHTKGAAGFVVRFRHPS